MSKAREGLDRIRDLPDDELAQAHDRAREELFRLRLGNHTNQVENTVSLRYKRREVARIITVQRARELALEAQASAGANRAASDEGAEADEPQTVADRARAAVGRPRTAAKGKPAARKPAAKKPAAKKPTAKKPAPAAKATGKAKAGAKSSKKSGKE
ncbi:MAG TPA: 50S ribosomal protein L29 [Kofleriaceae bacterium]|nr:50S ribosomal protein L29 [Kofleriaceae bacterium]